MENEEQIKFENKLLEAGRRLKNPPTSKEELLEALEKVEANLLLVEPAPSVSTLNAMFPSKESLISPYLMRHPDKDVMLLVISCFTQLTKITAPHGPYDEKEILNEIFELIVGSFKELGEMNSPSFKRKFGILKTVEEVKLCTVMLDLDDLVIDMVKHLLSAVSQNNYSNDVHDSIKAIICGVLDESDDISDKLLSLLLINLRREMKYASPATHSLCLAVVASCAEKLTPYIRAKISSNQEHICNCVHAYNEIVYDICTHENQEIDATQHTTASPEVILPPGSGNAEPVATSVENPNSEISGSELVKDENTSKKIRNKEAENKLVSSIKRPPVGDNPMPMADREDSVGLTEGKAGEKKNNPLVPTSSNPNTLTRRSPRGTSISEMERTAEAFVGRRIKVWWPKDKRFYEGAVKSYDPKTRKHTIFYDDGDREDLRLWRERWEFIDHVPSSSGI